MRNTCYVRTKLDMPDDAEAQSILDSELSRWGAEANAIDAEERSRIISIMHEQVEARFLYDYRAVLDYSTGSLSFMVPFADYDKGGPWRLDVRKGHGGGLHHDDDGTDIASVASECSGICAEYVRIALSYSAAGVSGHVRQN